MECARRFVTIPVDEFRTSYTHHELGCTLQRVEMEKCLRSPEDIKKYGRLTEEQMERMSKVRGLLALVSTTNDGKKRMEFVNRDFDAAINIRKCAVMENRPPEWTRVNFVGQSLKVELYEKKLEAVFGRLFKKTGRHLHVSWRRLVQGAVAATTVHARRRSTFERRLAGVTSNPCQEWSSQKQRRGQFFPMRFKWRFVFVLFFRKKQRLGVRLRPGALYLTQVK